MRRFPECSFLFLAALIVAGCEPLHQARLMDLAPASSVAVLKVDWREVQKDEVLKRLAKSMESEKILQEVGIDSAELKELVLFTLFEGTDSDNSGAIMAGSYNLANVIGRLKTQGYMEKGHRGYKVFLDRTGRSAIGVLKASGLVVGSKVAVERVIDVDIDPQTGIGSNRAYDKLLAKYGRDKSPVALMAAFPQIYHDTANTVLTITSALIDYTGARPLGQLVNKIGVAQGFGFSIARKDRKFPVEMTAIMKDEGAATFVSGGIGLVMGASSLMPSSGMRPADRETKEKLESLVVQREGAMLTLKLELNERDLRLER